MPSPDIQLICFDLGGVLVRLARTWQRACEITGIALPAAVVGPGFRAWINEVVDTNERGQLHNNGFDELVAAYVGLAPSDVRRLSSAWLLGPYPGIDVLIDRIAAAGLRTACLSNTNAHHWSLMSSTGHRASLPLHRLDHRFASHLIGLRKPEAAIYEHVEREAGVCPEAIVFFDDAPENIAAALARGWRAHRIDPLGDTAEQMTAHLMALNLL